MADAAKSTDLLTITDAITKGAEFLAGKGVQSARLDAELLIAEATSLNRLGLYLNFDRPLTEAERLKSRELLQRRAKHEPVAYILKRREFRSREFAVDQRVLIPRPETELLVDLAKRELAARFPAEAEAGGAYRILELGAGSGAICVSLAVELPEARIVTTESSAVAAEVAKYNAQRHGVADRIDVRVQSDFAGILDTSGASAGPEQLFHALVSNPPYIDADEAPTLPRDVREFEPHEALFAADHGLSVYRRIFGDAPALIRPGGFILVEIGGGQAEPLRSILAADPSKTIRVVRVEKDYAGIERMLLAEIVANFPV